MTTPPTKIHLSNELDDALELFLDKVDTYQSEREALASDLKKAFFDLAKAKLAIGPSRLCADRYNLAPQEALKRVSITDSETPILSLFDYVEPPPAEDNPSPTPPSTLRHRKTQPEATLPSPPPSPPPPSTPPPSRPRDPAHQFSAFPPPTLKAAQAGFVSALERMVGVLQTERQVKEAEQGVRKKREAMSEVDG